MWRTKRHGERLSGELQRLPFSTEYDQKNDEYSQIRLNTVNIANTRSTANKGEYGVNIANIAAYADY